MAAGIGIPSAVARSVSDVDVALDRVGAGPFLLDARIDPAGYRRCCGCPAAERRPQPAATSSASAADMAEASTSTSGSASRSAVRP